MVAVSLTLFICTVLQRLTRLQTKQRFAVAELLVLLVIFASILVLKIAEACAKT